MHSNCSLKPGGSSIFTPTISRSRKRSYLLLRLRCWTTTLSRRSGPKFDSGASSHARPLWRTAFCATASSTLTHSRPLRVCSLQALHGLLSRSRMRRLIRMKQSKRPCYERSYHCDCGFHSVSRILQDRAIICSAISIRFAPTQQAQTRCMSIRLSPCEFAPWPTSSSPDLRGRAHSMRRPPPSAAM